MHDARQQIMFVVNCGEAYASPAVSGRRPVKVQCQQD